MKITPEKMRHKFYKIADRYSPVRPYLKMKDLRQLTEDYTALYEVWLTGRDIKAISIDLGMSPDEEEAVELTRRLRTKEDFISEMTETMNLLVDAGAATEKNNRNRPKGGRLCQFHQKK